MVKVYTKEELRERCPAAFAEMPSHTVSDKYTMVNTESIIDALVNRGWYPVTVNQQTKRGLPKESGAHHITFQHENTLATMGQPMSVGDTVYRIGLWNSHNGLSALELLAELYRCVCSNQAIMGVGTFERLRIIHRGEPLRVARTIEASVNNAIERGTEAIKIVDFMRNKTYAPEQVQVLAGRAVLARWPDVKQEEYEIKKRGALVIRRQEDEPNNAWAVFNRIQENLLRGHGVRNFQAVRGLNSQVELNQQLFDEAYKLAQAA